MKEKTINNILNSKFDYLLKSIDDESVKKLMQKGTIITGGCITSLLLGEEVNDFDCYFLNKETAIAVANYYVKKFQADNKPAKTRLGVSHVGMSVKDSDDRVEIFIKSAGVAGAGNTEEYGYFELDPIGDPRGERFVESAVNYMKSNKEAKAGEYKPLVLTSNAISLSSKVQLIIRFFGAPDKIHDNFDFVHCTNYWTSWDRKVTYRKEALLVIMAKELKYVGALYPICSMFRIRKFIQREWTITAGEILKIAFQISNLDLTNIETLNDQLVGVDVCYFVELIEKLKEYDGEITETYIAKLVDEI